MKVIEVDGFLLYDGVPIGSVARIAYEDATIERGVRGTTRVFTGHATGTYADGGATWRELERHFAECAAADRALAATEAGCIDGAARAWVRWTAARCVS